MDLELSAVVIYDSVLYGRTGQVRRWADSLTARMTLYSAQEAPKRSGDLANSIEGSVARIGPKHLECTIEAHSKHALYVLRGTTGPIMSRRLWGFRQRTGLAYPRAAYVTVNGQQVPSAKKAWKKGYALKLRPGHGFPTVYKFEVAGQDSNDFFARAAERTAVRHPSLRGWAPGRGY